MAEVIANIYEKDINELSRKVGLVAGKLTWVQIDIADNSLVPNESVHDIRLMEPTIKRYKKMGMSFEAHMMVADPVKYLDAIDQAGFSRVIAHIECNDPREFLSEARSFDMEIGFAVDADTPIEQVEPFLEEIDCVLIMTADAGFSGQTFQEETVEKIRIIHRALSDLPIGVDCGMNEQTAAIVRDAGATRIGSTSYIFKDESAIDAAIASLAGEE